MALPLGAWPVKAFAAYYKIRLDEAEFPIQQYKTINALFTRRLKSGIRPIESDVVHPVDSTISQHGPIYNNTIIQAKGRAYRTSDLLQSEEMAAAFEGGYYITYYLCPTDYHRIHSPVAGQIIESQHIPGKLWPVNSWSVNSIKDLFAINERVNAYIQTGKGMVVSVMVGATNVGKITLAYDKTIVSNQLKNFLTIKKYQPGIPIEAGGELGTFNMGSTVVQLYSKDFLQGRAPLVKEGPVKLGQRMEWK